MEFSWLPWPTQRLHAAVKCEATWGYVIYRTTYTSQSNTAFPQIVDLLNSYIKDELFSEYTLAKKGSTGTEPTPYHEIWSHHLPVIMADPAHFDGASTEWIQDHFQSWVNSRQKPDQANLYPTCIVIDEESLQEYVNAPPAGGDLGSDRTVPNPIRFVKVITASSETSDDEYDSFMGDKSPNDRPERVGIHSASHRRVEAKLSDSDDDEYDGFMGG